MKIFLTPLLLLMSMLGFGQGMSTIRVSVPNATDEVYLVGNQESLGNWEPNRIKMERISDYERALTLQLTFPAEFKFTRGSWESEAVINTLQSGGQSNLRLMEYTDKAVFRIQGWSDQLEQFSTFSSFQIMNVASDILGQDRRIYVGLPENYNKERKYPVVYITDAQNLNNFEMAMQTLRQQANYKVFPECILVGVYHFDRFQDIRVGNPPSVLFKDFLFKELVPYIDAHYASSSFRAMIGHSDGAEFNHFLMMQNDNPFDAFVSFSEEIGIDYSGHKKANAFLDSLKTYILSNDKPLSYFVANGTYDIWHRRAAGEKLDSLFKAVPSQKLAYKVKSYPGEHNDMVAMSMLDGLRFTFRNYRKFEGFKPDKEDEEFDYLKQKDAFMRLNQTYVSDYQFSMEDWDIVLGQLMEGSDIRPIEQFLEEENKAYAVMPRAIVARIYYQYKQYDESLRLFNEVLETQDRASFAIYEYGNFDYVIDLYVDYKKDPKGAIAYLERCKALMPEFQLQFAYYIAKTGIENGLHSKHWKDDLRYCKENYQSNRVFTKEDLEGLKR